MPTHWHNQNESIRYNIKMRNMIHRIILIDGEKIIKTEKEQSHVYIYSITSYTLIVLN